MKFLLLIIIDFFFSKYDAIIHRLIRNRMDDRIRIRAGGHCIIYHISNTFNIERNKGDNFFDPLTRTGGLVIL